MGKASAAIQAGQTVKVGYFNLEGKEVSAAGNGYNGKGLVFVPFLKANVNVSFSDLRTNKSGRAHTVGNMEATTDVENELAKILKTATPTIIDTAINRTITALVASNPKKRMTINRSVNDKTPIGLPLILGSKDVKGKSLPSLVISKIRFAARKATVDIAMSPPSAESSVKANFWKTEVPIVPSGIPANPQLDLVSNMVVPIGKGGEIAINLNTPESKATKARCDCKGFNAFAIQGKYAFPEEFVSLKDGGKPLIGSFSARSQHWGNLILEITGVEKFGFTPMEGFVFGADRVVLDFSKKLNVEKLKTPKNFGAINNEWIGIYLPKVTVTIPKSVTGSKDISFKGENMMLDDNGLFAKLSADNLLKVNEGKIGSWGFGNRFSEY